VAHLEEIGDVKSERVKKALLEVPRHMFVPAGTPLDQAYANEPLAIGCGQTISQPTVVALMSEALELTGKERVLEIGTGSGYQAALLSVLAAQVYSVEYFAELAESAADRIARLGYTNVQVRCGDGNGGWPEHAPFDRIIATAASPAVPEAWFTQLDEGGVLVAPVGSEWGQSLLRYRKRDGRRTMEDLGWVAFVPLLAAEVV
jgi:protein-L-isoaspartate(D-aspartate) O-methyltransferase